MPPLVPLFPPPPGWGRGFVLLIKNNKNRERERENPNLIKVRCLDHSGVFLSVSRHDHFLSSLSSFWMLLEFSGDVSRPSLPYISEHLRTPLGTYRHTNCLPFSTRPALLICCLLQKSLNGMSGDFLLRMPHPLSLLEPLESLSLSDPFQPLNKTVTPIPVDWRETAQAHVFEAELPGVKKENVKVQIQNGVLEIIGKQDKEEGGDERDATWHSLERPVHHYGETRVRQLSLPADANVDEVKASMENGVLTVRIPKKERHKSNVKNIEIEVVNKEGIGKKIVKSLKGIIAPAKAK